MDGSGAITPSGEWASGEAVVQATAEELSP